MQRSHKISYTPNLRTFISKVITPTVLILGLIVLIVYNFRGVLKTTQADSDHFHGLVSFNQGALNSGFKLYSGLDRPLLKYGTHNLLSYAQWSSTITIDGNVIDLWNNEQSYSYDEAKRTVYSTISGDGGWQLNQVTTLVDDHTAKITYNFTARTTSLAPSKHYVIDIAHIVQNGYWYGPQVQNTSFKAFVKVNDPAGALSDDAANIASAVGAISLSTSGGDLSPAQVMVPNYGMKVTNKGNIQWTQAFMTRYTFDNPTPLRLINLGSETITFQPGATSLGAPVGGPVPLQ